VLALDLLRVAFARLMLIRSEMTPVSTPIGWVIARDATRLQQRFELEEYLILAASKDLRQHLSTALLNGRPQPPWLVFLAHVGPKFIDFRCLSEPNHHRPLIWVQQSH
jgi:hypothetical protein